VGESIDKAGEELDKLAEHLKQEEGKFKAHLQSFAEDYPLYKKLSLGPYKRWADVLPQVIYRHCNRCKAERPFKPKTILGSADGGAGNPTDGIGRTQGTRYIEQDASGTTSHRTRATVPPRLPQAESEITKFEFVCTACDEQFIYWIEVNYQKRWMWKVGQVPIWLPPIPKDIEKDLGDDAELYKKALRNMNESYGIGAVAYLRRLLENQINPLLSVLHEIKAGEGASAEELETIKAAIKEKNFTKKTEFASDIAPSYIMVEGFNPFKIIHDNLSDALHNLDEETCMRYATEISDALVYIIRGLKKHHEERREYANKLKAIRGLSST
jgi:hypothetical protein